MISDRIERYVHQLAVALRERGAYDRGLLDEVRAHLRDSVDARTGRGQPADVAEADVIRGFGTPELIADQAAAGVSRVRRTLLLTLSATTFVALAYLTLSILIVQPPRAHYLTWFLEVPVILAQAALTFAWARRGGLDWAWGRIVLLAGGGGLLIIGAAALYNGMAGHFEGFRVILGVLLSVQGVLTIAHLRRPLACVIGGGA